MRRVGEQLTLTVEQRAAASHSGLSLHLKTNGSALALEVLDRPTSEAERGTTPPSDRIRQALAEANAPMQISELRSACRIRNATLRQELAALIASGHIHRSDDGYRLAPR